MNHSTKLLSVHNVSDTADSEINNLSFLSRHSSLRWSGGRKQTVTQLSRILKAMVAKRRNDNFAGMEGN